MTRMSRSGVLRDVALACVLIGGMVAASAQSAKRPERSGPPAVHALLISDIHFEPFWDPAKVAHLKTAPLTEWKTILAEPQSADREAKFAQLQQTCHARGEDSTYALYESSLKAMHANARDANFVMLSGDLISHDFACKFNTLVPGSKPSEYRAFVQKTIDFVLMELRRALPGVPVYAALGNNDSDCGDYQLDAGGLFLGAEAEAFTRDFAAAERPAAMQTFAAGGYYSVKLPAPMEHARLLVLDDAFLSRRYTTCGGKADASAGEAQIAWLDQQLEAARKNKEMIWVMAHIPPGVDPYSTAAKGKDICAGNKPTMFLSSDALPETLAQYGDVIRLAIFAHTHMDEVRWLAPAAGAQQAGVAVKMVPSISPINGNNPAFTIATIDAATAVMKDYRVIAASNKAGADTTWAEEYDYTDAYKEPDFSAASLQDLIGRFESDRTAQSDASQSFIHNYDVGQPARELGVFWPQYVCALKNDGVDAFRECVCGK